MKSRVVLLIGAVAVLAFTACRPTAAEFDTHVAAYDALRLEFDALKADLIAHAGEIEDWETRTRNVLCDVVAKNPPSSPYDPATTDYCSDSETNGVPPDPPDFE